MLADGRYKDNRIPPKGFDLATATPRISEPVWHGASDPGYFSAQEYAGGYDDISLSDYPQVNFPSNAASVEVILYYQGTSREYVEFLRDEINGNQNMTLPESAYIIQTDPFFAQLKEWGNTIWKLWEHNHGLSQTTTPEHGPVEGIVPFMMAQATVSGDAPCTPPASTLLSANPGDTEVTLGWSDESADPNVTGYKAYYDQAGKALLVAEVGLTTTYPDTGLTNGQEYCYKVTALYDCDAVPDAESGYSNILCATPANPGQTVYAGVDVIETGKWITSGKGKNQTTNFELTASFNAGDEVVIRAYVVDEGDIPLADATVEIVINDDSGTPVASLLAGPSDADGMSEAAWQTQRPNKKGIGGTPQGLYRAVTNNVTASGYVWDGVTTFAQFEIQ